MNDEKLFRCSFGSGVAATIRVCKEPPAKGSSHILGVEWTGRPKQKHFRKYIEWMNSVNQQLADEWKISMMHVFQTTPQGVEVWTYAPGEKPRRVDVAAKANDIL